VKRKKDCHRVTGDREEGTKTGRKKERKKETTAGALRTQSKAISEDGPYMREAIPPFTKLAGKKNQDTPRQEK